jgi:hypothetical protein
MSSWATRRERRDRRDRIQALGAAILLGVATIVASDAAQAELVAAWNFNAVEPIGTLDANAGKGWIDLGDIGGTADLFSGTLDNAIDGWDAGDALGLRGTAEGGWLTLFAGIDPSFGEQAREVVVSFATRRSATGFAQLRLDAWGGGGWTEVATAEVGADWSVSTATFMLSNWATDVELRLVPVGATAGSGTFRLDNVVVDVSTVPAPGALAVMGAAVACAGGRRRDRLVGVARR